MTGCTIIDRKLQASLTHLHEVSLLEELVPGVIITELDIGLAVGPGWIFFNLP